MISLTRIHTAHQQDCSKSHENELKIACHEYRYIEILKYFKNTSNIWIMTFMIKSFECQMFLGMMTSHSKKYSPRP